jgi:hypothetical protein
MVPYAVSEKWRVSCMALRKLQHHARPSALPAKKAVIGIMGKSFSGFLGARDAVRTR